MTSVDEQAVPFPDGDPGRSGQPGTDQPGGDGGPGRRPAEPDAICAQAVPLARSAAEELAGPDEVGDHLGLLAEGERLVTHYFASRAKGYRGWRWAISVARPPRARSATVCETVLLPGDDAVLAPPWVPWSDRLAPGDLGAADVLPYREDDPLLEPGYTQVDDEEADRLAVWELGLGRPRVLGPDGRDAAADRWYHGDRGPTADEAVHAAAACSTCGYFLPLAGSLRRTFGVCANEWSSSDGRVVSVDHGCGAHSETDVEPPRPVPLPEPILDETGAEAVVLPPRPTGTGAAGASGVEASVSEGPVPEASVSEVPVPEASVSEVPVPDGPPGLVPAPTASGSPGRPDQPPLVVGDGVSEVPVTPVRVTSVIELQPHAEPAVTAEPGPQGPGVGEVPQIRAANGMPQTPVVDHVPPGPAIERGPTGWPGDPAPTASAPRDPQPHPEGEVREDEPDR